MKSIITQLFIALVMVFSPALVMAAGKLDQADIERAAELRDKALKSDLAYDILESLTTEVGPRMAGTEGDKRAVKWAKN